MNDVTPPPERPLSEDAKSRMRAGLGALDDGVQHQPRRGTLVSLVAAAAVLAVIAVAWSVAAGTGESGSSDVGPADGAPSPTAGPTPATDQHGKATPTSGPSTDAESTEPTPSPTRTVNETVATCSPGDLDATCASILIRNDPPVSCDDAITHLDALDGATVTASRDYDRGSVALYETKDAWVICDSFASNDGGEPTLLATHRKANGYQPSQDTLAISENFTGSPQHPASQYFAAGSDFDGVAAIAYHFPDGHTEHARVGETGMWSMEYLPSDGPLNDFRTNQTTLDPITVHVTYTNGTADDFTLQWGLDTCSQTNHGC